MLTSSSCCRIKGNCFKAFRRVSGREVSINYCCSIKIFLKYKFIYFNWRLITLQYCISFAIHQHESATGIHMIPILNPPHLLPCTIPLGHPQCTSPKHPVSCIEPGLVIHFLCDIIHVSMPFPQIIPLSPSPTESKRLFYTSVSLLLSYRVIVTIFLNSIYMH